MDLQILFLLNPNESWWCLLVLVMNKGQNMDIENIMSRQDRYQPMDLYFKTRVWIAHHLPEIVYELLYIGHAKR